MHLVSIRTTWFTQQRQWGLYQNKVTSSLAAMQRPGHWIDNCKMVYSQGFFPGLAGKRPGNWNKFAPVNDERSKRQLISFSCPVALGRFCGWRRCAPNRTSEWYRRLKEAPSDVIWFFPKIQTLTLLTVSKLSSIFSTTIAYGSCAPQYERQSKLSCPTNCLPKQCDKNHFLRS